MAFLVFTLFVSLLELVTRAQSHILEIASGAELLSALNDANGVSYTGTTIVLTDDIDVSVNSHTHTESFSPIGAGKISLSFLPRDV